jgi:hypothetical protein
VGRCGPQRRSIEHGNELEILYPAMRSASQSTVPLGLDLLETSGGS